MAHPNAQLQAVIHSFAKQPGVTPDQVAQLQATISQQADLLTKLNQDAANGLLHGFARSPAGSGNLVGTYDKTSGVVSLPAESFQPTGQHPSADLSAVLRVQDMSMRFAQQPGVTQGAVTNLQDTLNQSPVLAQKIKQATTTVDPTDTQHPHLLEQFVPLSQTNAGGTFDGNSKTMSLPLHRLTQPPSQYQSGVNPVIGDMTYVIGHEIQHSFNHPGQVAALSAFSADVHRIARDKNPINDYTVPLENYLQSARQDEAKAQLAGWNATLSRVQQSNPQPALSDVAQQTNRAFDFVQSPPGATLTPQNVTPRPRIHFNPDLSVSMSPANITQLGKNYFDKQGSQSRLGHHGDSDYANSYGAPMVGYISQVDRQYAAPGSRMQLDMQRLGLDEYLLERNGIDLGHTTTPKPYFDTSQPLPNQHHFDHTKTAGGHQHIPIQPSPAEPAQPRPISMKDTQHPGHWSFQQALDSVHRMEAERGIASGPHSEQLAAAVAVKAEQADISFSNLQLRMGSQGQLNLRERGYYASEPDKHHHMDTGQALQHSVEQHSLRWHQARSPHYTRQAPAAERSTEQQQALQQLSRNEQALFQRYRVQIPPQLEDATVLAAMVQGREHAGIHRPEQLGAVTLRGEYLFIKDNSPASLGTRVNLSEPTPPLRVSLEQNQAQNQQLAQQQMMDAQQREQQEHGQRTR